MSELEVYGDDTSAACFRAKKRIEATMAVVEAARAVAKSARRNHKGRFTNVDRELQNAVGLLEELEG